MEFDKKLEIERRFIIAKPTPEDLEEIRKGCDGHALRISKIEQVYLFSLGTTHRVRRREDGDGSHFFETVKRRVDGMSAEELEREISESEYLRLKEKIRPGSRPIIKTRYSFFFGNQSYEIDVYPFWERTAMLELELDGRDKKIEFPKEIRVIREVTGERKYSNSSMADAPVPECENIAYL